MSFSTQPAFIHTGSWDDTTRGHPCMKWMYCTHAIDLHSLAFFLVYLSNAARREQYTNAVDAKAWDSEPSSNWMTSDHKLYKSTGELVSGGEASFFCLSKELYAPFSAHLHDPDLLVCWESDGGWEMLGVATVYWNLAVPSAATSTSEKIKDRTGKEWEGAAPGAFAFKYAKQADGGIKLAKSAIYTDSTKAVVEMMKRGMIKPDDLMK